MASASLRTSRLRNAPTCARRDLSVPRSATGISDGCSLVTPFCDNCIAQSKRRRDVSRRNCPPVATREEPDQKAGLSCDRWLPTVEVFRTCGWNEKAPSCALRKAPREINHPEGPSRETSARPHAPRTPRTSTASSAAVRAPRGAPGLTCRGPRCGSGRSQVPRCARTDGSLDNAPLRGRRDARRFPT